MEKEKENESLYELLMRLDDKFWTIKTHILVMKPTWTIVSSNHLKMNIKGDSWL